MMSNKTGVTLVSVQSAQKDINNIMSHPAKAWLDSFADALYACTDALLMLNEKQPVDGWKLPAVAMLYNEQQEIVGAFVPSFAETWDANHRNTEGIYIPRNNCSDFLARVQSALHAWDLHYFDNLTLTEPKLMPTRDNEGNPVIFEHYGATRFNPDKVETRTCGQLKPAGFWACKQYDDNNWEAFRGGYIWHTNRIEFAVHDSARILSIDSIQDIQYLQKHYPIEWSAQVERYYPEGFYDYYHLPRIMIDWAQVAQDYDGIWYNHSALGNAFGPYDMNSISVFNPDVMEIGTPMDVIRFPAADDEDIMKMLSEDIKYDEMDYYGNLQYIADIMLSRITPGDTAREEFYTTLYNLAFQSYHELSDGECPILADWGVIADLNEMSDNIRDVIDRDER